MLKAASSIVAPFAFEITGLVSTLPVVLVEIGANCAEIAGAPLTVVFPLKPAAFKVSIMSSTDLFKRDRCSAYDGAFSPELVEASFAGNSD